MRQILISVFLLSALMCTAHADAVKYDCLRTQNEGRIGVPRAMEVIISTKELRIFDADSDTETPQFLRLTSVSKKQGLAHFAGVNRVYGIRLVLSTDVKMLKGAPKGTALFSMRWAKSVEASRGNYRCKLKRPE